MSRNRKAGFAYLLLGMTAVSPAAAANDLYWDGAERSVFLTHPDYTFTYVGFRITCDHPRVGGQIADAYRADFDLGWTDQLEGEQDVAVTIDDHAFSIPASAHFSEMDEVYILSADLSAPGDFLDALGSGDTMTMAAAGRDFTVALEGTGPLVETMIANCPLPLD